MINWLIQHYAEIAVYSALASLAVGLICVIIMAIIKLKMRMEMAAYLNNIRKHRNEKEASKQAAQEEDKRL